MNLINLFLFYFINFNLFGSNNLLLLKLVNNKPSLQNTTKKKNKSEKQ